MPSRNYGCDVHLLDTDVVEQPLTERLQRLSRTQQLHSLPLAIHGDNASVVAQLNGQWKCNGRARLDLSDAQQNLWRLSTQYAALPYDLCFAHHVPRSLNKVADELANRSLNEGNVYHWSRKGLRYLFNELARGIDCKGFLQVRFDGAFRRGCGRSAIGVSIEFAIPPLRSIRLLDLGREVQCKDSYMAEMMAANQATHELLSLYTKIAMSCSYCSQKGQVLNMDTAS